MELPIIGNIYLVFGVNAIPKNSKNNLDKTSDLNEKMT